MKFVKKENKTNSSSLMVPNEEMTRHMKQIFEERTDPDFKARQQIKRNREELKDKSELGI